MTTTSTTPVLNRLVTALLGAIDVTGINVVKSESYDPETVPTGHAVLVCVIEKVEPIAPGVDSYFVDVAFQAATLISEDEDKSLITALREKVMKEIAAMTTSDLVITPATVDGIIPGQTTPQQQNESEFVFTAKLRLAVSNLNT